MFIIRVINMIMLVTPIHTHIRLHIRFLITYLSIKVIHDVHNQVRRLCSHQTHERIQRATTMRLQQQSSASTTQRRPQHPQQITMESAKENTVRCQYYIISANNICHSTSIMMLNIYNIIII